MCLFKPCCLIGDVWYLLTWIAITLRRWGKCYFSRTRTVKDAQKWMFWCNFLHLCFQREKNWIFGKSQALDIKEWLHKQGNRSCVISPHRLNVQPFIYFLGKEVSCSWSEERPVFEKQLEARSPGRWRVEWSWRPPWSKFNPSQQKQHPVIYSMEPVGGEGEKKAVTTEPFSLALFTWKVCYSFFS